MATAASRGRIALDREVEAWLDAALPLPRVVLLPVTPRIAARAARLGEFHGDSADRLIVATALVESCPLVTKDRGIRRYRAVSTIW